MRIAICTDSSSLLSAAAADNLEVDVVPVAVALDGEPFDDRAEPIDDFYAQLREGAVATTSQPSPSAFAAAYERAASRGAANVVSIHLDSRTSGTVSSAEVAASEARLPVTVVDTGTVSFGVAVCVRAAAGVAAGGGSAKAAAAEAARLGAIIENAFVARAGPGGRVPEAADWAVLRFEGGTASTIASRESIGEAVEQMTRHALRSRGRISAAVGYAGPEMETAADELAHGFSRADVVLAVERYRVGASIGAHTGSESLGALWWPTP